MNAPRRGGPDSLHPCDPDSGHVRAYDGPGERAAHDSEVNAYLAAELKACREAMGGHAPLPGEVWVRQVNRPGAFGMARRIVEALAGLGLVETAAELERLALAYDDLGALLDETADKAAWCLEHGASGEALDIFESILSYRECLRSLLPQKAPNV